jgi:hypothetical protein
MSVIVCTAYNRHFSKHDSCDNELFCMVDHSTGFGVKKARKFADTEQFAKKLADYLDVPNQAEDSNSYLWRSCDQAKYPKNYPDCKVTFGNTSYISS